MNDVSTQSVIRVYDRYAPFYDLIFGNIQRAGCRRMAARVAMLGSQSILEVGVGTGLTLAQYPVAARITGIDLSASMLEHARRRAEGLPDRDIRLSVMDAEHLQFADDSFDCVTVPYVLSVTPNPDRLVAEIRRVCKTGGHILIVNHFSGNRFWRLAEKATKSFADRIGFRSDFDYARQVLRHDWTVLSSENINRIGLYRLVVIRND